MEGSNGEVQMGSDGMGRRSAMGLRKGKGAEEGLEGWSGSALILSRASSIMLSITVSLQRRPQPRYSPPQLSLILEPPRGVLAGCLLFRSAGILPKIVCWCSGKRSGSLLYRRGGLNGVPGRQGCGLGLRFRRLLKLLELLKLEEAKSTSLPYLFYDPTETNLLSSTPCSRPVGARSNACRVPIAWVWSSIWSAKGPHLTRLGKSLLQGCSPPSSCRLDDSLPLSFFTITRRFTPSTTPTLHHHHQLLDIHQCQTSTARLRWRSKRCTTVRARRHPLFGFARRR